MGYSRAKWSSGLIYEQTCDQCKTTIQYKDDKLGYRPWFPDGFVYCPTCEKPLRHKEEYALGTIEPRFVNIQESPCAQNDNGAQPDGLGKFCTQCGKAFGKGDRFCSNCGTKRV